MMRNLLYIFVICVLMAVMAACGINDDKNGEGANSGEQQETITVQHELGETDVTKKPEKVVVFDFGVLDTLDVLGINVAGVPRGNMPTYLEKYDSDDYEHVGSLKEPDFDKIANINPDLIIISSRQATLYDELSNIGPTVYLAVDAEDYMDSFEENLTVIGMIFDKEAEIEKELEVIKASIDELQADAEKQDKHSLIILANDDKISAYGPHSRFGLIHDVFGIPAVDENIEASTHGQNVSFEYVLEKDPDLLYVIDRGAVVGGESSAQQVVENKLVQKTSAYQNDDIVYLDPNYWYLSGGGLISVQEMVNEIMESLNETE